MTNNENLVPKPYYDALKEQNNALALEHHLLSSKLLKLTEALETIKLATDGRKTLNNASINKICTEALTFKS